MQVTVNKFQLMVLLVVLLMALLLSGCDFNDTDDAHDDNDDVVTVENGETEEPDIIEGEAVFSENYGNGDFEVVFLNPGYSDEFFWLSVS